MSFLSEFFGKSGGAVACYKCEVCGKLWEGKAKASECAASHLRVTTYKCLYRDGERMPYKIQVKLGNNTYYTDFNRIDPDW